MKKLLTTLGKLLKEDKLDDYSWLIDNQIEKFMYKRVKKMLFSCIISSFIFITASFFIYRYYNIMIPTIITIMLIIISAFICFKWDYWKLTSLYKTKRDNVYKSFPLWVSTLEILVMTNNIPNTFKKSIATCPEVFRKDLIDFVDKIQYDPENKAYYRDFLSRYSIDEVTEIIMDMYAFNRLNKDEIVYEFKNLNERLNKISARIRKDRQDLSVFIMAALNSIPLFVVSIYVLLISMLINVA